MNERRIRRLTPLECFRLMSFDDEDYYKLESISDSQKYKMAGNSIVVKVLEKIFYNIFVNKTRNEIKIF
jgi:DNA (cytosine-5)-methyltransferase 1